MLRNTLITLIAFIGTASFASAKTTYKFQPKLGKVEFKTKGWPNLITINGTADGFEGTLVDTDGKVNGTLTFELEKLKTGISLRDDHMKNKYLQVKQFPKAELTVVDLDATKTKGQFKGQLQLHGETRPVTGSYKLKGKNPVKSLTAEMKVKLSDFKIPIPSYQGITVAEEVTINISSKIETEKPAKLAQSR